MGAQMFVAKQNHDQIVRACERAARYRRAIALEAGERPGKLEERIASVPAASLRSTGVPKWFAVGAVVDAVVGQQLGVEWNPETDEVRVQHPVDGDAPAEEPAPETLAFSYSRIGRNRYQADAQYRYFLDGTEYTAKEATKIANKCKNIDGWTWTKVVRKT